MIISINSEIIFNQTKYPFHHINDNKNNFLKKQKQKGIFLVY